MNPKTIEVIAGIIEDNGRYLIAQRAKEKSFGGMWEFPGGKVKEGETHEECLYREIQREEFPGVEILVGSFFGESIYEDNSLKIRLLGYLVRHMSGKFKPAEHTEIRWVYPNEFDLYEFAPADLFFKRKLQQG